MVGKSCQRSESLTLAPVLEIWSRGFQLFDEQSIVRQPQPGEQFQVSDYLVQLPSDANVYSHPPWAVTGSRLQDCSLH